MPHYYIIKCRGEAFARWILWENRDIYPQMLHPADNSPTRGLFFFRTTRAKQIEDFGVKAINYRFDAYPRAKDMDTRFRVLFKSYRFDA